MWSFIFNKLILGWMIRSNSQLTNAIYLWFARQSYAEHETK